MTKRLWLLHLLVGAGLVLVMVTAFVYKPLVSRTTVIGDRPVTRTITTPSEVPVTPSNYTWQGSDDQPKSINLPSINASGYIEKMGVNQQHAIAVPSNIHLAGWFVNSAKPGKPGLSIILGHINGRTSSDGIFRQLAKLKAGNKFSLTLGSGVQLSYQVMTMTNYDDAQAANYLFSQDPTVKSQLNLITCGGEFNYSADQYNQRTIVTAKLLAITEQ